MLKPTTIAVSMGVLGMALGVCRGARAADACRCECATGVRLHDGFFLRSSPGVVMFRAAVADGDRLRQRTRIDGIGLSSALAVGGTPWPGIVLGGRIWTANVSPRFVEAGKLVIPDDDSVKLTLLRMGPFVDWYPFPHTGFHTLAEAGWTTQIERDTKGHPSKPVAMGAFVALFTGYEWFVSKQLSFGFLAGIAGGHVRRDRQEGYESSSFLAPELTLTATYH